MTTKPSQRTPEFWERVAREYCRSQDIDPDARTMLPGGGASAPYWKKPAAEVKRLLLLAEAYDTVEDQVEDEEREAKFGPWLPVPADGSAPPLPPGLSYEVRRRDGNDEFYAAGSFGPSRWGGDDDWSLVEYRVEKFLIDTGPHPREPIPVGGYLKPVEPPRPDSNWGPWHTFKPGDVPVTPPGCDVELMFASGHTRRVPANVVRKCWSVSVESYRVEWPTAEAEIPSVCAECGESFSGHACPRCGPQIEAGDRIVWSPWVDVQIETATIELKLDREVRNEQRQVRSVPAGSPIPWDFAYEYRWEIGRE